MRTSSIAAGIRVCALGCLLTACSDDADSENDAAPAAPAADDVTLRADVQPVTRAADALPGVFIPPFLDCREPQSGEVGEGVDGKVCTNVAISGCTEEGKYFPDYAECDVVRTQRPFWPEPPANMPRDDDPRLADRDFMTELAWMTEQVRSAACVCCHDSRAVGGMAGQWDIALGPIWLDTLSDSGLALFVGYADSSVLGAYPARSNHGFDRARTGIPTTDTERMQAFLRAELERRGISEAQARAVPPFGGPIYANAVAVPGRCRAGEGITPQGEVRWLGSGARYVYVAQAGSKNPGVPPNLDSPEGTLWRLDVLPSKPAVTSGLRYGATPDGSFQALPAEGAAPQLERGHEYLLTVLRDVGLPNASCLFTFGDDVPEADTQSSPDAGSDAATYPECEPMDYFGKPCTDDTTHAECGCAADYCAIQPGQTEGYCTATGCVENPAACPKDWSCFDVSTFQPGAPAICLKP
jgi:hypothetical protein